VVNRYYAIDSSWQRSCSFYMKVTNSAGLSAGDRVLVIQHQGATIYTSNNIDFGSINYYGNAGNYEIATIGSISGNVICFKNYLTHYYSGHEGAQIVKLASYPHNARITGTITCPAWNGTSGGVIALEVHDTLILSNDIDASGMGFRGGSPYPNQPRKCGDTNYVWSLSLGTIGPKGEGLLAIKPSVEAGRGRLANGGGAGNSEKSGGGGGGNANFGGLGGSQSADCGLSTTAGIGGLFLDYSLAKNGIYMGGGGGAGEQNSGQATAGANGGGIVFITAPYLKANQHKIDASGWSVNTNAGNGVFGDGAGGGGAGGCVLLNINALLDSLQVDVKGGNGGNTFLNSATVCNGPGGGGSGGAVLFKSAGIPPAAILSVNGGNPGIVINPFTPCGGTNYDAEPGQDGLVQGSWMVPENKLPLPSITSFSRDTFICQNDSLPLFIQGTANGSITYKWAPADHISGASGSSPIVYPNSSTYYIGTVMDIDGCEVSDTIHIKVYPLPASGLNHDYILLMGSTLSLDVNEGDSIYWSPAKGVDSIHSLHPIFNPIRSTLYHYFLVDSNHCIYRDSLYIRLKQCTELEIPNIFTPNGDGVNDHFTLEKIIIEKMKKLTIWNRWGEKVFETTDINAKWDGTWNGRELPMDSYTFELQGICDGADFIETGSITLIR